MKAEKLIINGEEQELFDWNYSSLNGKPTLWTAASKDVGTNAGNVPVLDANWKLDSNIVPSTWVMTSYTVTNKSDLTTLSSAVKWDIWIVTSENKTYILSNDPYSTLSNWTELLFPTGSVSSVNWFTWAVNLTTGYIQESNNNLFVSPTEKATWNNKLWANNVSTVALTGNFQDLNNKPVIDTSLNTSSTNAIQNWAVATAVNNINTTITSMQWDISDLQTASGWAAQDISDIKGDITTIKGNLNTKTFPLSWLGSSAQVLQEAQAIYDWYTAWKNPLIIYGDRQYALFSTTNWLWFASVEQRTYSNGTYSSIEGKWIIINSSDGTVTRVIEWFASTLPARYLDVGENYQTAYTPQYDWSPATKKYVDDSVAGLWGLKFQVITQTAYTALNGTYAPNTVYLIKQG